MNTRTRWLRVLGLAVPLLALLPIPGFSSTWSGRVVAIHDGDTLTALRRGRAVKIRLNAIDAPELDQPHGQQSRKSLSGLCYDRQATVEPIGEDKYERLLARVRCGGLDINSEQLRRGMAWHYAQYSHDSGLQKLEDEARARRLGLWAQSRPEPPWAFRHGEDQYQSPARSAAARPTVSSLCGSKRHCGQMRSCAEAYFYFRRCGVTTLDGNQDGTPCEDLCVPRSSHR